MHFIHLFTHLTSPHLTSPHPLTHSLTPHAFNSAQVQSVPCRYGLVYPGLGWVIWRSKEYLPESIVFHVNYLGSDQASVTLNFSRGAGMIVAQYYQVPPPFLFSDMEADTEAASVLGPSQLVAVLRTHAETAG